MQDSHEIRYAKAGDLRLAYQSFGDGPVTIVFVPALFAHIESSWDVPDFARFWQRLARFGRVVLFDKRGTGLSDRLRPEEWPTLEERAEDITAVMDAIGLRKAALLAAADGGPVATMFAATYPERTAALLLYNTWARLLAAPDFSIGFPNAVLERLLQGIDEHWGSDSAPLMFEQVAPSRLNDPDWRRSVARMQRRAASPSAAGAVFRIIFETDARALLPAIRVPTLVLHVAGNQIAPFAHGRYLAERIPSARLVELKGTDDPFLDENRDAIADAIQEFLTGARPEPDAERVLTTILFTDIVGSTRKAAALGDRRWRQLLDEYREQVRREVAGHRGREIDIAGDGFLATFDGPARAVRCAVAIRERSLPLDLAIRAGVHTGEVEITRDGIAGIAVHIGARVADLAEPGEVLVSTTVRDLVAGSGITFADRGTHALKGVPDRWHLFSAQL